MKIKSLITALGLALSILATAQQYCLSGPVGYGSATTGGKGKSVKTVKNQSELATAVKNGNAIIVITQSINLSGVVEAKGSNYTLMAMPGVTLTNSSNTKDGSGILYMKGASNVILRNLTLKGPGSHDVNGRDNLTVENCTKVWVDHCDIMDGCDGNFDITKTSDNISVTWCRFRYTKSGDHNFSNLVGSTPINKDAAKGTDYPNDGYFNVTYAGCWWDEGCVERMTRARFAQIQFVNCYWKSSTAKLYFGAGCNAYGYFDGCYMNKLSNYCKSYTSDDGGGSYAWKFVNSMMPEGTLEDKGTMTFTPTSLSGTEWGTIKASDVPTIVTNSTCGAGATLNVTEAGVVSSSCSSSGGGNVDPDPTPDPTPTPTGETETTVIDFTKGSVEAAVSSPLTASCVSVGLTKSSFDNGFKVGGKADEVNINISSISGYVITNVQFDVTYSYSNAVGKVGTGNPITYTYNTGSGDKTVDITSTSGSAIANINFGVNDNVKTIRLIRNVGTSMTIGKITLTLSKVSATTAIEDADAEKAEWTVTNDEVLYSADVQKISIYDFAGHNLLSGSLVSYLNISGLAAGNYIAVAILPNGKLASLKFNKK
ncbi:MAG: hypothetical protein IJP79_04205 [Paludibacteraceae bacterium]|nr:hypothetical protein [Paludibacteraceae bacterium]MBQ6962898.1 hypothetical protein [Paludibacteraceae bacterium]